MLNIGMSFKSDIDENLATVTGELELTARDRALLAEFSGRAYDTDSIKNLPVT
jgi:hypothetical protein